MKDKKKAKRVLDLCYQFTCNYAGFKFYEDLKNINNYILIIHNNFLKAAALDFCKLFGGDMEHYRWDNVVYRQYRTKFKRNICKELGIEPNTLSQYTRSIKTLRNKYIAHLDPERDNCPIPNFSLAFKLVIFYHDFIKGRAQIELPYPNLKTVYEECHHKISEYITNPIC